MPHPGGDLLTEPHEEQSAGNERGDAREPESSFGVDPAAPKLPRMLVQFDGDAVGLNMAISTDEVAGVPVDLLAARLAFLRERLPRQGMTAVINWSMMLALM